METDSPIDNALLPQDSAKDIARRQQVQRADSLIVKVSFKECKFAMRQSLARSLYCAMSSSSSRSGAHASRISCWIIPRGRADGSLLSRQEESFRFHSTRSDRRLQPRAVLDRYNSAVGSSKRISSSLAGFCPGVTQRARSASTKGRHSRRFCDVRAAAAFALDSCRDAPVRQTTRCAGTGSNDRGGTTTIVSRRWWKLELAIISCREVMCSGGEVKRLLGSSNVRARPSVDFA